MTTRSQWAVDFLTYGEFPYSTEKEVALVAQASKENSGNSNADPGHGAISNPLDTEEDAPGTVDYNAAGVKSYPTYEAGLAATLATFRNGHYPHLLSILEATDGGSATQYATSPDLNTWGTGNCLAEVEEIRSGDPHGYMSIEIAGGAGPAPAPPAPAPAPKPRMKGPTMFITQGPLPSGEQADFLVSGGVATWIPTETQLATYTAAGVISIATEPVQFALFKLQS